METNNIFTKENLGIIIDRMESAKGEPMGREYQAAAADWDEVAAVLDPTAPRATGRDRVFVNGLQAWISRSGSDPLRPGIVREDVAYDSHGNEKNNDVDSRGETAYAKRTNTKKYDTSYIRYLVDGPVGISPSELRALQVDSDVAGGYIVSPEQMSNKLVQGLDEQVFFRSLATKYSVPNAVSLGVPVLDNDISDSDWTSELGTGSEDSTMSFGKRELNPHPLAKRIKVSNKLLRASTLNAGDIVQSRLLYKFAVTEEKAFLTGHGNNQPLGVFVASDNGISTSRDVSEGNTTTSITTDGLIEAYHGLSPAYQKNAVWCFHPDAIKQIRKLKDGDGQYIWQAGLIAGAPDKILNRPYFQSEWAPNTFTSGQYVGIVGDFSFYWIADALKMQIQRLIELYAETNQTGFIGRLETDGMPVLQAAFSRVTLA